VADDPADARDRLRRLGVPADCLDGLSEGAMLELISGLSGAGGIVALSPALLRRLRSRAAPRSQAGDIGAGPGG